MTKTPRFALAVAATTKKGMQLSVPFTVDLDHEQLEVVPSAHCHTGCAQDFEEGSDKCVEHERTEAEAIQSIALLGHNNWNPPAAIPPHVWLKSHKESQRAIQAAHRALRARDHSLAAQRPDRKLQSLGK